MICSVPPVSSLGALHRPHLLTHYFVMCVLLAWIDCVWLWNGVVGRHDRLWADLQLLLRRGPATADLAVVSKPLLDRKSVV